MRVNLAVVFVLFTYILHFSSSYVPLYLLQSPLKPSGCPGAHLPISPAFGHLFNSYSPLVCICCQLVKLSVTQLPFCMANKD